jgi:hypothetical protein
MQFSTSLFYSCVKFFVVDFLSVSEAVRVVVDLKSAWSRKRLWSWSRWLWITRCLLRSSMDGLLNRRSLRRMRWHLILIQRRLKILEVAQKFWRKMGSKLARLNPVVLEFWKSVLFSSDEFVDLTLVKVGPQMLFLLRKIVEMELFTALKF